MCFDDREASGGCQNGSIGLSLSPSCDARNGLSSVLGTDEKSRMENGKGVKITRAEDHSSRGTCASWTVTGALKVPLSGAAQSGEDERERVYRELRLAAIHEGSGAAMRCFRTKIEKDGLSRYNPCLCPLAGFLAND